MEKAKKLLNILREKEVKEGLRANLEYFTLIPGEHPLGRVLDELQALVADLEAWREDRWDTVTAMDSKHQEVIPLKKGSGRGDMAAARSGKPKGPNYRMGMIPRD